ncbi:class I SAM-dependent methyltransferase [Leucobacter salsicius]|uniref:class I SAM-dependent methyltransferase n=1 Tax=Leucobacter salsicius TaxID=664638 RepID=UPI00034D0A0F|nr:class I SAM-dependent methyltransferase [Leucobacter salsicius]
MITKQDLHWWYEKEAELDWQFATTYAEGAPHEYVALGRTEGLTKEDFVRAAHVIRTFGEPQKFYKTTRIYLTTPMGWRHWTMDSSLEEVGLVNRGAAHHVYGAQNAPITSTGLESGYDALATTWDKQWGMTTAEKASTSELIRAVFGDNLWRTLDVGCGTGFPLDAGLVESVRYVGIDSSTAMLNCLVAKHPLLAGVHPMTFEQATVSKVLCGTRFDTVLALGGSASYLSPADTQELRDRSKRNVLLMHYRPGANSPTQDLDMPLATQSFRTATEFAKSQYEIGQFIVSVL